MADTKISDVIVPELFTQYVINKTAEKSALWGSGVVGELDVDIAFGSKGGTTANLPFWNDLSGDSEVLSDSGALTVNAITAAQDLAILHARGKAWGVNDLAKALSGDDPMGAIADLAADYWAREMQKMTLGTLKGVFGAASMTGNMLDISTKTGADAVIAGSSFVDAAYKLGDSVDKLTAVAMHSATMAKLAKDGLIETIRDADGVIVYRTFMDKRVIVDDGMPNTAGVYTTYLFGAGAIGFQDVGAPVGVETDRDSLAGTDILINRRHFVLHPRGVKWAGSAGIAPANAGLAVGTNWERVYEPKTNSLGGFQSQVGVIKCRASALLFFEVTMGLASFNKMRREAAARLTETESGEAEEGQNLQDYNLLKVDDLKVILTEKGIEFDAKAKKADLLALLQE